ncbi:hypothetical protein P3T23_000508 [Paraburkholderia sp. GAS448]
MVGGREYDRCAGGKCHFRTSPFDRAGTAVCDGVLEAIDHVARDEGKTVLVLDTVTGGDAERWYERAGWQRAGIVPKYGLMPDGGFCGTTFFYKHL